MRLLNIIFITLVLVGCAQEKESPFSSDPAVMAANSVDESFVLSKTAKGEKINIGIKKSALEKEFLFESSLIEQIPVPQWQGLRPRVVAFREFDGSLYMLEATQGHVVNTGIPAQYLIAEFKITRKTASTIYFDFDGGMSKLYTAEAMYASDSSGRDHQAGDLVVDVETSFLLDANLEDANNRLVIRQVAQLKETAKAFTDLIAKTITRTVEVKYNISPYRPNLQFAPTKSTNFDWFGFFEGAPFINEAGGTDVLALKFDTSKPIVFAISANTPADYIDAVKEGVLYWNKAFGSEVVKVIMAPEGVSAPSMDYNMVQWIQWDQAGFAYADVQPDPRTGEVLHAQVFMTSVFAVASKNRARTLLGRLKKQKASTRLGMKGFESTVKCDDYDRSDYMDALEKLVNTSVEDEVVLRFSQDYVRNTIAHEVGHNLGLRHNFAGSLATTFSLKDLDAILKKYLVDGEVDPSNLPSSSVMEYTSRYQRGISGHQVKHLNHAFDYDKAAIEHLYKGVRFEAGETPLFCTDTHAKKYIDCRRHDRGNSILEHANVDFKTKLEEAPYDLLSSFIVLKVPYPGDEARKLSSYNPKIENIAVNMLEWRHWGLDAMAAEETKWLRTHRQFEVVGDLTKDLVQDKQKEDVYAELKRIHMNMEEVFFDIPSDFKETSLETFTKLITGESREGRGAADVAYRFTNSEIEQMTSIAEVYFEKLEEKLILLDLEAIKGKPGKVYDGSISDDYMRMLTTRAKKYGIGLSGEPAKVITWEYEETKKGKDGKEEVKVEKVTSELANFRYSKEIRSAGLILIRSAKSDRSFYGEVEREALKEEFDKILKKAYGAKETLSGKALEQAPYEVREWIRLNNSLKGGI